MKSATVITFLRAHKRLTVIAFAWVAFFAFWLFPNWREGPEPFFFLFFSTLFVMLIASQLFWIGRVLDLAERLIPGKPRRAWLGAIGTAACLFLFAYNVFGSSIPRGDSTHLTLRSVLFEAPFAWWFVGRWRGSAW